MANSYKTAITRAWFNAISIDPDLPEQLKTQLVKKEDELVNEALIRFNNQLKHMNLRNDNGCIKAAHRNYIPATFGQKLSLLLKEKHMNIMEVAEAGKWHHSTVYGWFAGKTVPSARNLYRLAKILDEPPGVLMDFMTDIDL